MNKQSLLIPGLCIIVLAGTCAAAEPGALGFRHLHRADPAAVLDRLTWGVNETELQQATAIGIDAYLEV